MIKTMKHFFPFGWRDHLDLAVYLIFIVLLTRGQPVFWFALGAVGILLVHFKEVADYHAGKTVWKFRPITNKHYSKNDSINPTDTV